MNLVRIKGLEPSLLSEPEPKSGASANSAISAWSHSTTIAHNCSIGQPILDFKLKKVTPLINPGVSEEVERAFRSLQG
jgi:hypothetical protein